MAQTGLGSSLPTEAQAKYQAHINGATQVNVNLGTQATIAFTLLNDAARLSSKEHLQRGMTAFNQVMGLANTPDAKGLPLISHPDVSQVIAALQISINSVTDKLGSVIAASNMTPAPADKPVNWLLWGSVGLGVAVALWLLTRHIAKSAV